MKHQEPPDHRVLESLVCDRETEKAICVHYEGLPDSHFWIPKSLVHDDSECYKPGTSGTLVIPEWIAIEKGMV